MELDLFGVGDLVKQLLALIMDPSVFEMTQNSSSVKELVEYFESREDCNFHKLKNYSVIEAPSSLSREDLNLIISRFFQVPSSRFNEMLRGTGEIVFIFNSNKESMNIERESQRIVIGVDISTKEPFIEGAFTGDNIISLPNIIVEFVLDIFRKNSPEIEGGSMFKDTDDGAVFISKSIEDVIIPDSVTVLAKGAFKGFSNINNVTLNGVIENIPDNCFSRCYNLESVDLRGVKSIGEEAFSDSKVRKVILDSSMVKINEASFKEASDLQEINLGSIKSVGIEGFSGCHSLNKLDMPRVEIIEEGAFYLCTGLELASLPKVKKVGGRCFYVVQRFRRSVYSFYSVNRK